MVMMVVVKIMMMMIEDKNQKDGSFPPQCENSFIESKANEAKVVAKK